MDIICERCKSRFVIPDDSKMAPVYCLLCSEAYARDARAKLEAGDMLANCKVCQDGSCKACKARKRRQRANEARKARDEAMRSLGLKKVRGARGGTYWE